ncbi:DUF4855 domain-containing protein [Paenibacillus sp. J5C_2022]|nr:DUF4855 domain-containing protein [Paenibacillus sp. J5C2022]
MRKMVTAIILTALLFSFLPVAQAEDAEDMEKKPLHNLAQGLPYEWSEQPDAQYPDTGYKLTDGVYGELDMTDPAWIGHVQKKTREVIFDLGEPKSIASISARFLQDWPTNTMLVPLTVSMYVSDDRTNWGVLSHNSTQLLWGDGPPREEVFEWDGSRDGIKSGNLDADMAYARYVKVTFSMHTRAWSFIDEIEIMGRDGQAHGAVSVPPTPYGLLPAGEATAGIRNLGLLYNGQYPNDLGTWTKERIIPNISYVDAAGEPVDWLFDGVLYLGLHSPAGRGYNGGANLEDWTWYLDKTFANTGDMDQLNEAAIEVGAKLSDPGHKVKVVLMIPDPGESMSDFGDVDGDNVIENFNASGIGEAAAFANREKVIQWYLDEVELRWAQKQYSHLELAGMYWLEEQINISETGPDLILSTSEKVHAKGMKFFWIPHFLAYKSHMWKDVGIDAVSIQPNYFFEEMDYDRLEDAANIAKSYGMSLELEFDDRMLTDSVFRERYVDYLNSGVETGLMHNGFKAYYQGNNAVYNMAVSTEPATRILYDWLYQFTSGTYQPNNALPPEAIVQMNGQPLQSGAVIPSTEPLSLSWQVPGDDGSGLIQASVQFDGQPYTAGTELDLSGKPGRHEVVVSVSSGKTRRTTYIIEAAANADTMRILVDRFAADELIASAEAANSLRNYLEMLKQYEGNDPTQARKFLSGLNDRLEQLKQTDKLADEAYNVLKESIYAAAGNLALDKPAQASTVEAGKAAYSASKAVDGLAATRWSSEIRDDNWFQIDLGEPAVMDTVRIHWEYARAKTYKLLVSLDGQNWSNVTSDNNGIITAKEGKEVVSFPSVEARYLKFEGVERATFYGYSFYELSIYNLGGDGEIEQIEGLKASIDNQTGAVSVQGLIMSGEPALVSLKVIDPAGDEHYDAQAISSEAGDFQFQFSAGALEGVYEAQLMTDEMDEPVTVTFNYEKPGTGTPSYPSYPVPVADLFQQQHDGSMRAVLKSKLEGDGKLAVGTVSKSDMRQALAKLKPDKDGKRTITIELKPHDDATQYAVELPAAYLSDQDNLLVELVMPNATLLLTGQMLVEAASNGKLRLIAEELEELIAEEEALAHIGDRPVVKLSAELDGQAFAWENASAPLEVILPYTRLSGEKAARIGIMFIDGQGTAVQLEGADYSAAGKHVKFSINRLGSFAISYTSDSEAGTPPAMPFTDMNGHAWAQDAVMKLAELGIVKGTSDSSFNPAKEISRADFTLMLVRALGLQGEAGAAFSDVNPDDYYYEAVSVARQLGIISGIDDSRFAPQASITRQDMIVMAARALAAASNIDLTSDAAELQQYADSGQIAEYAAASIAGMIELELIKGDGDMLKPRDNSTRAETAVFLYRLLQHLNQ